MKIFRNVNERLRKKGVQLLPFRFTVIAGLLIAALMAVNVISYTGGRTYKNIDCDFIRKITYRSVYQDSFGGRQSSTSQLFMGTRLEIFNLRKCVYRTLKKQYGRPKRLLFRTPYSYILEGNNGKIVWDYGEMKKSYSKRIGIDKKIYYFDIRFIPSTIDER